MRMEMHIFVLHVIIIVEVVNMTNNTQFKTLLNTWLNQKKVDIRDGRKIDL